MAVRTVERFQNPTCNDIINLRLFTYNNNSRKDVLSIAKVDIYTFDQTAISKINPDGSRLVATVNGTDILAEETGQYLCQITATSPLYTIGAYKDVWTVTFEDNDCSTAEVANYFEIYPDLWFTTAVPPVYDFNFTLRPNRIRQGSKGYLLIQITPNVPRGSDIENYYQNLAIVSDLKIYIEQSCGDCLPQEKDLRLIVDGDLIDQREKCFAYYFLDTTDYDCGIYDVWFELNFGENTFISDRMSFEIFD